MAIEIRGSATSATSGTSAVTSQTIAVPTGLQPGDHILIFAGFSQVGTTAVAGFNAVTPATVQNIPVQLFYRRADGSEGANFTFTSSPSTAVALVCVAYSGVNASFAFDPQWPYGSGNSTISSTTVTATGITTIESGDQLIWFGASLCSGGTTPAVITQPTGYTSQASNNSNSASKKNAGVMVADIAQGSPGATGNVTGTLASAQDNIGLLVALQPGPSTVPSVPPTPDVGFLQSMFDQYGVGVVFENPPYAGNQPGGESDSQGGGFGLLTANPQPYENPTDIAVLILGQYGIETQYWQVLSPVPPIVVPGEADGIAQPTATLSLSPTAECDGLSGIYGTLSVTISVNAEADGQTSANATAGTALTGESDSYATASASPMQQVTGESDAIAGPLLAFTMQGMAAATGSHQISAVMGFGGTPGTPSEWDGSATYDSSTTPYDAGPPAYVKGMSKAYATIEVLSTTTARSAANSGLNASAQIALTGTCTTGSTSAATLLERFPSSQAPAISVESAVLSGALVGICGGDSSGTTGAVQSYITGEADGISSTTFQGILIGETDGISGASGSVVSALTGQSAGASAGMVINTTPLSGSCTAAGQASAVAVSGVTGETDGLSSGITIWVAAGQITAISGTFGATVSAIPGEIDGISAPTASLIVYLSGGSLAAAAVSGEIGDLSEAFAGRSHSTTHPTTASLENLIALEADGMARLSASVILPISGACAGLSGTAGVFGGLGEGYIAGDSSEATAALTIALPSYAAGTSTLTAATNNPITATFTTVSGASSSPVLALSGVSAGGSGAYGTVLSPTSFGAVVAGATTLAGSLGGQLSGNLTVTSAPYVFEATPVSAETDSTSGGAANLAVALTGQCGGSTTQTATAVTLVPGTSSGATGAVGSPQTVSTGIASAAGSPVGNLVGLSTAMCAGGSALIATPATLMPAVCSVASGTGSQMVQAIPGQCASVGVVEGPVVQLAVASVGGSSAPVAYLVGLAQAQVSGLSGGSSVPAAGLQGLSAGSSREWIAAQGVFNLMAAVSATDPQCFAVFTSDVTTADVSITTQPVTTVAITTEAVTTVSLQPS